MRLIKHGTPFILAALLGGACATPTDGGDGDGDGDGDVVASGGAIDGGTGGGVATGGTDPGVGGGVATGGAAATGGGAATGGAVGTGGTVGGGNDCAEGTIAGSAAPSVLEWSTYDGNGNPSMTTVVPTPPAVATTAAAAVEGPYVAAILTPWAATGRTCMDVSSFTGVQFTVSADTADLYMKVIQSKSDPSGSCTVTADCYSHPVAFGVMQSGSVQVPWSAFAAASWGTMTPFDATQVFGFVWGSEDTVAGKMISITDLALY